MKKLLFENFASLFCIIICIKMLNFKSVSSFPAEKNIRNSCSQGNNQCQPTASERFEKQNTDKNNYKIKSLWNEAGNKLILIGGLFEVDSRRRQYALSEYAATLVALKHINNNGMLDEYTIDMISNDTKVRHLLFLNEWEFNIRTKQLGFSFKICRFFSKATKYYKMMAWFGLVYGA